MIAVRFRNCLDCSRLELLVQNSTACNAECWFLLVQQSSRCGSKVVDEGHELRFVGKYDQKISWKFKRRYDLWLALIFLSITVKRLSSSYCTPLLSSSPHNFQYMMNEVTDFYWSQHQVILNPIRHFDWSVGLLNGNKGGLLMAVDLGCMAQSFTVVYVDMNSFIYLGA